MLRGLIMFACHLMLVGIGFASWADEGAREIARRPFAAGSLRLLADEGGLGQLLFTPEKGVARPDLIYAIIPSPSGPMLARGAVMSYREFLHPMAERLTDEAWREMIAAERAPKRPDWLAPIYADVAGPVTPHKQPQYRCGPSSGARLQGL